VTDDVGYICPPEPSKILLLDAVLAVGFGFVTVKRNRTIVWRGDDEQVTLDGFETAAQLSPGKWTVFFYGPLSDQTYERKGKDEWVLTKRGQGFA